MIVKIVLEFVVRNIVFVIVVVVEFVLFYGEDFIFFIFVVDYVI